MTNTKKDSGKASIKKATVAQRMGRETRRLVTELVERATSRGADGDALAWLESVSGRKSPPRALNALMLSARVRAAASQKRRLMQQPGEGESDYFLVRLRDDRWKGQIQKLVLDARQSFRDSLAIRRGLASNGAWILRPYTMEHESSDLLRFEQIGIIWRPRASNEIADPLETQRRSMHPIGGVEPIEIEPVRRSALGFARACRKMWSLNIRDFSSTELGEAATGRLIHASILLALTPLKHLVHADGEEGRELVRAVLREVKSVVAGNSKSATVIAHPDRMHRDAMSLMRFIGSGDDDLPYTITR